MRALQTFPLYQPDEAFGGLFRLLNDWNRSDTFAPSYDLQKLSGQDYELTLAVPGFAEDDLQIETVDHVLRIRGEQSGDVKSADADKQDDDAPRYIHRGIVTSNFERQFELAEHIDVRKIQLKNGLLRIQLRRNIPEAKRPRRLKIGA